MDASSRDRVAAALGVISGRLTPDTMDRGDLDLLGFERPVWFAHRPTTAAVKQAAEEVLLDLLYPLPPPPASDKQ